MITIHAIMLVSLGFLSAILLGLVIVPAYRKRIARLTRDQIKQAMPLTESEIRADKDRLRADYAIVIHELDAKLEKRSLDIARQRVEINRRDAAISGLEGEVSGMRTSLDEHENARRVLEHTIMDRLPKVEQRLLDARKLLTQRDREIAKLSTVASKRSNALDEASQINAQNRDEIHRLNAALTTRAARSRGGIGVRDNMADGRFNGEVALRSEIEALRAKTRDQANMVARLQGLLQRAGGALAAGASSLGSVSGAGSIAAALGDGAAGSADGGNSSAPVGIYRAEDEIVRLRNDLSDAEATLRSVATNAEGEEADRSAMANELRVMKAQNEDQSAEIAQLKAALIAYQSDEASDRAIPEGKVAMHARISQLNAVVENHSATIGRLRAEVAASNEKLARQALHFTDEMRRMGAGSIPMAAPRTGRPNVASAGVAARGASAKTSGVARASDVQLSDRISDPRLRHDQRTGGYGELRRSRSGATGAPGGTSGAGVAVASAQAAKPQKANGKSDSLARRAGASAVAPDAANKTTRTGGGTSSVADMSDMGGMGERARVADSLTRAGGEVNAAEIAEAAVEIRPVAVSGGAPASATAKRGAHSGGAANGTSDKSSENSVAQAGAKKPGTTGAAIATSAKSATKPAAKSVVVKKDAAADGDSAAAPRRGGLLDRITRMDGSK